MNTETTPQEIGEARKYLGYAGVTNGHPEGVALLARQWDMTPFQCVLSIFVEARNRAEYEQAAAA
jgi:hypothetical protein